jgi:glycosyltransferase involved in cell wall biosynthesis
MQKELFSIITVCSNPGESIIKTVDSVRNQTYGNIEYIVIDNESSDGTIEYLNKLKHQMSRFCYYSEPDDGIYDAINKGISLSTGTIIGIIHAGDEYMLDACQKVSSIYKNSSCPDVVYGGLRLVFNASDHYIDLYVNINMPSELKTRMSLYHPSIFIHKIAYNKYGAYNNLYSLCADYELLLRYYDNHASFVKSNSILSIMEYGGVSTQLKNAPRMVNEIISFNGFDESKSKLYYKAVFIAKMFLYKIKVMIYHYEF